MLYAYIVKKNKQCVVTFIDYTAAFDSIPHKFIDTTLEIADASRKSRSIFRAIYSATTGTARVRSTGGENISSGSFKVARGVIQGDSISPILFIITLDHLIQQHGGGGKGV